MKIFGREPSAWAALASILVQVIGAFVADFDSQTQAWTNAVVVAVLGLVVAVSVGDGVIAAIAGLAQAVMALAVGLGLDWSAEKQALVLSLVVGVVQFAIRQVVVAPVPPTPAPRRKTLTGV